MEENIIADFLKNNGFNLANGLTLVILIASVALIFGTVTADVKNLQKDMLTKESKEVAKTRDDSIIRDISVLRGDIREIRDDIHRVESKIDEIILKLK